MIEVDFSRRKANVYDVALSCLANGINTAGRTEIMPLRFLRMDSLLSETMSIQIVLSYTFSLGHESNQTGNSCVRRTDRLTVV